MIEPQAAASEAWRAELEALREAGRLRERPVIDDADARFLTLRIRGQARRRLRNWASNDYLGLGSALVTRNAASRQLRHFGSGAGAARLLAGGLACHRVLEQAVANWLDYEDALLTSSGYQANLALLPTLAAKREDVVLLDRLCHASLYDAAALAAGERVRFAHNDLDDLRTRLEHHAGARRRVVCVESVYSMDGDEAPLAAIAELCAAHDAWLVVDEAHAIGVYGPGGRGLCAEAGVRPQALVTTCSKALGAQGGLILGDSSLIELVVNRGRSFIYSTAPVPAASGAAHRALKQVRSDPEAGARLRHSAEILRAQLVELGWRLVPGRGPIIPILTGDETTTLRLADALREAGHYAPAIRPPTVPAGACRIRLTLTAAHQPVDIRRLLAALGPASAAEVGDDLL